MLTQSRASRVFSNTLTQAPAHNPQPGIEGHPLSKRDGLLDGVTDLFNATDMVTGYDKMRMGDVGEPMSVYPEGWNKVASYVDVASLPIFKTDQKVDVASANANDWLDGFYDDDLWWALAWIAAYDVTKDRQYLTLADSIFKSIATTWGTNCGSGGIWWSWKQDYANAIANELFLSTAAHLANRLDDKEYYVKWAKAELDWFLKSGMINDKNLINDGLTKDCNNNGQVRSPTTRFYLSSFPANNDLSDYMVLQPRRYPRCPCRTQQGLCRRLLSCTCLANCARCNR